MDFKGGNRENRVYVIIAVIILIVILVTVILSSNKMTEAYVSDKALGTDWYEDFNERYIDSQFIDLEKQASFTYRVDNSSFSSFLTVNTYKTIFMINEKDLYEKTDEAIKEYMDNRNVTLDFNSIVEGERKIANGHKTKYIRYNGTFSKNNYNYKIKVIGETWNCDKSGTSIIAIGFSQITNNSNKNLEYWNDITRKDGLIYNIICH